MHGRADTRVPWPLVASLSLPTAPSRAESLALRPLTEIVVEIRAGLLFSPLQLARIWNQLFHADYICCDSFTYSHGTNLVLCSHHLVTPEFVF